jgi:UDP-N-acetylmuramyl tripeptide synthase
VRAAAYALRLRLSQAIGALSPIAERDVIVTDDDERKEIREIRLRDTGDFVVEQTNDFEKLLNAEINRVVELMKSIRERASI